MWVLNSDGRGGLYLWNKGVILYGCVNFFMRFEEEGKVR